MREMHLFGYGTEYAHVYGIVDAGHDVSVILPASTNGTMFFARPYGKLFTPHNLATLISTS